MASTERDVELADGLSARRDVPSTWSIGAAAVRRVRLAEQTNKQTNIFHPAKRRARVAASRPRPRPRFAARQRRPREHAHRARHHGRRDSGDVRAQVRACALLGVIAHEIVRSAPGGEIGELFRVEVRSAPAGSIQHGVQHLVHAELACEADKDVYAPAVEMLQHKAPGDLRVAALLLEHGALRCGRRGEHELPASVWLSPLSHLRERPPLPRRGLRYVRPVIWKRSPLPCGDCGTASPGGALCSQPAAVSGQPKKTQRAFRTGSA